VKYCIVYLIRGEAGEFQQKILYDVAKKFRIKEAIIRKPPAHLTLKYSFVTNKNNINELKKVIELFCIKQKKTKLKIDGFGSFDKEVIFLEPIISDEMRIIHSNFIKELKKLEWLTWKEFDGKNIHFHSTIAMKDFDEKQYKKIMDYVKKFKPKFNLLFDNITLLKKWKGIWKIHKIFEIK